LRTGTSRNVSVALATVVISTSLAAEDIGYGCGQNDTFTINGRLRSFISQEYAESETTDSWDIALHIDELERRIADGVSCQPEDCDTSFPYDCLPTSTFTGVVVDSFASIDAQGNVGWTYVFAPYTISMGCTECQYGGW
jgi:hypothetical protein